jgi:hypothetical protein
MGDGRKFEHVVSSIYGRSPHSIYRVASMLEAFPLVIDRYLPCRNGRFHA